VWSARSAVQALWAGASRPQGGTVHSPSAIIGLLRRAGTPISGLRLRETPHHHCQVDPLLAQLQVDDHRIVVGAAIPISST